MNYRELKKDSSGEIAEYHRMRFVLWSYHEEKELYNEMLKILDGKTFYKNELSWTTFVAERENGDLGGFIEITLYPELDFSDSKPIGFIEGWHVDKDLRMTGVGRKLVETASRWVRSQGCRDIASDVEEHNLISQEAHLKLGFKEVKRADGCVLYKKTV